MLIITLFLDFSIISKITSLICILALIYVAYKRYMGKNEEDIWKKGIIYANSIYNINRNITSYFLYLSVCDVQKKKRNISKYGEGNGKHEKDIKIF